MEGHWDRYFTDDHEAFRRTVRSFVEKELAPHSEEWEAKEIFPREVFKKAGDLGLLGVRYPEDLGGSGLDYWYTVAYAEELPRARCAGLAMALMVQTDMATPVINDLGTPEQKSQFLAPAIKGDWIAALGVTEPGCGSDVASIRTTARKVNGDFVIDGQKTFITNGTRADFITLILKTNPEAGYAGVSIVLFPTDTKGFQVGRKLKKLGNRASDTAELYFDGCRVPQRNLLGEENMGFMYLMRNFQGERLIAAVSGCAGSMLMWQEAVKYGSERHAFGRPVVKFQVWKHLLADLLTEIEVGRAFTYHACDLYNRKVEATREISMAKLYVGEMMQRVADRCLQIHGGYGYMEEYDISRAWRDARLITIGGGTSEVMREIISKLAGL